MYMTFTNAPPDAPWVDSLSSGVRRSWLATRAFGGSQSGQVSMLSVPPAISYQFTDQCEERICVLIDGDAEVVTANEIRTVHAGAVIHSRSGDAFTVRTEIGTAKLLILSETPRLAAGVDQARASVDTTPVECFSLYDVQDEVLHQPEAGFFHMGTRMLLNAGQGGYQSFILGQSSFAPTSGIHVLHRHPGADEIFYVWEGEGAHLAADGTAHPMSAGDAVFVPRHEWHGFRNIGDRPVRAFFSLIGAGGMSEAGNEVLKDGAPVDAFVVPTLENTGPTWMTEAQARER